ncbi:LysR family transcriptional regulator [Burkholderia pseudomallei]|nr:LysR family transcriptional regulator [Burkholderia pseudomallei]
MDAPSASISRGAKVKSVEGLHVDELGALVAIARDGSFSAAARRLKRHPTVISKRIASLEERLGVRLVERTSRKVTMTPAATLLVSRVNSAAESIYEAEQEAAAGATELRGSIRMTVPAAMGRLWFAPRIPAFIAQHPHLEVDVDYSERYVDLVAEGFDVAIRVGTLADSRLVASNLGEHRMVLGASPGYVSRYGYPASPNDLRDHHALIYTGPFASRVWGFSKNGERQEITPEGSTRSNDLSALIEAAKADLGIARAGEWAMTKEFASGQLVPLLPEWKSDGDGGIYLVRPSKQHVPVRISALMDWLRSEFQPILPWKR